MVLFFCLKFVILNTVNMLYIVQSFVVHFVSTFVILRFNESIYGILCSFLVYNWFQFFLYFVQFLVYN